MSDWDDINREIDNSLGLNQDYWGESNDDYYGAASTPKYGRHPLTGKIATLEAIEAYNASLTPATTTPKTTTTDAAVEKALGDFFGDIEQDEDWIKEGAFSESSSLKDYLNPLSSKKSPTYEEYTQRKEALAKKAPDMTDRELSGLAYATAMIDKEIQGALVKGGLTGGAVTTGLSLLNSSLNQGKYFDAAKKALGLTDEEMTNISGSWGSVRSDSLKALGDDPDGFDYNEYFSGFDPYNQSVVLGEVAEQATPEFTIEEAQKYNTLELEKSLKALSEVDTDIEYNHSLAELSGIGLSDQEKEYFNTQKQTAIDRAIGEIENVYEPEGQSIVAQQIYNLGENALGGTIGREFVNRWQERYADAKTDAITDINSQFLTAEQNAINRNQENQLSIWDKQYEADYKDSALDVEKYSRIADIRADVLKADMDRYTTERGQNINASQNELDLALKEKLGDQEYDAYNDANKWGAIGGVAGSVLSSDWFGDTIKSWW